MIKCRYTIKKGKSNMENEKSRYWAFVIWPESLPEDWKQRLIDTHLEMAVSPLHDQDQDPDGPKKPHYHVLLKYGNVTTMKNISSIIREALGTGIGSGDGAIKRVNSARGYFRYLCHLDNPEKAQYKETDILYLNGFDSSTLISETDMENLIIEVSKIARTIKAGSYKELYYYLLDNGLIAEVKALQHNTIHFKALLDREGWSKRKTCHTRENDA